MKQAFLLSCGLIFSLLSLGQTNGSGYQDSIKISWSTDSISVRIKNQSFRLGHIQELDAVLKTHLPELNLPVACLESYLDLSEQDRRSIVVILDKYLCPLVSEKRVSDGKPRGARLVFDANAKQ